MKPFNFLKQLIKVKTDPLREKIPLNHISYPRFSVDRFFYTRAKRYQNFSASDKFANLGAGEYFYHKRWDCYDFYPRLSRYISSNYINWDFRLGQDLPSKYKLIYVSHVIEHIPSQEFSKFIDVIKNSLLPGGGVRFVYPDADLAYNAYMEKRIDFFEIYTSKMAKTIDYRYPLEFLLIDFLATEKRRNDRFTEAIAQDIIAKSKTLSKKSFLNFMTQDIYSNNESGMNHVNWFNHEKLSEVLAMKGFTVHKSAFGQSQYPPMREVPLFDGWLPCLSAFTEAQIL